MTHSFRSLIDGKLTERLVILVLKKVFVYSIHQVYLETFFTPRVGHYQESGKK